jgi:hypothetical protein
VIARDDENQDAGWRAAQARKADYQRPTLLGLIERREKR